MSNTFIKKEKGTLMHYLQLRFLYDQDNKFVYCLNPFLLIDLTGENYQSYTANYTDYLNISSDQWQRVMLLAYYGYGYVNHEATKWYSVTQFLIWQTVEPTAKIYFTDSPNGNKIIKYEAEIAQMEDLLRNHQVKPSFNNQNYSINLYDTINLTDTNQVFSQYQMLPNNNFQVIKNNNSIAIKSLNKTNNNLLSYQKTDNYYNSPPVIYVHSTKQKTIRPGSYPSQVESLTMNVSAAQIKLNITDNRSAYSSEAKFLVSYGLYDINNTLMQKITFDKSGQYLTGYLPCGQYFVRQLTTGSGYRLSETEVKFTINNNDIFNVNLPNYLITNEIKINKYYGNDKNHNYVVEPNAEFAILDYQGQTVASLKTDSQGQASIILGYGEYQIKQISGQKDHYFTNQNVLVLNPGVIQDFDLFNNLYTAPLALYLVDEANHVVDLDLAVTIDQDYLLENGKLLTADLLFGDYSLTINSSLPEYEIIELPSINIGSSSTRVNIEGINYVVYYIKIKPKPIPIEPEPKIVPPVIEPKADIKPQENDDSVVISETITNNESEATESIKSNQTQQNNELINNPQTKMTTDLTKHYLILGLSLFLYLCLKNIQKKQF